MIQIAAFIVLIGLFYLLVKKPLWGMMAIFSAMILGYVWFTEGVLFFLGPQKIYPQDIAIVALLGFLAVQLSRLRAPRLPLSGQWVLVFFAWGILAIFHGLPLYGFSAIGEARAYIFPILYYFALIFTLKSSKDILWFLKVIWVLIIVMLPIRLIDFYLLGGLQRLNALTPDRRNPVRFTGAVEALLFAFIAISGLISYFWGPVSTKKKVFLLYFSIFASAGVVVITQTRSVWIAGLIGLGVVALFAGYRLVGKNKLSVRILHFLAVIIVLIGLITPFVLDEFQSIAKTMERLTVFISNPEADRTGSWRLFGWQQEIKSGLRSPIIGNGLGGYGMWFDGRDWLRVTVHNDYIMFFSKFGLIGLGLFFACACTWLFEMWRYFQSEKDPVRFLAAMAIMVCVVMHMVFAGFYYFSIFFWSLLAVGTKLSDCRRLENQ